VSWQEEQRQLDEELSAGQISQEGYQRRRYELMYRYGGDEVDAAGDQPDPGPGDRSSTPFPPAFRWETRAPDESNETTQLFTPVDADQTQVVSRQPADPDGTQVVHGAQPAQPGRQGWGALDSTPPRTSSDLPPMQQPNSAWMSQQPETFKSSQSSRTPIIAVVALVVVLLLVVGGFGTYWLVTRDGGAQADQPVPPAAPAQQPPADQQGPPAPPPGADIPDPAEIGGDGQPRVISTLSGLRAAGVLTPEEYTAVAGAGATASKLVVSSYEDGPRASVLITQLSGADTAAATRDELAAIYQDAGFLSAPTPDPNMKSFYLVDDPDLDPTVRGVYHSGNLLVRMEVVGPEAVPTARRYDAIVQQQLATLPADE
jgi:hypothetical protein